uniref:Uncharacterized protein n=1 Tax=Cacopsylla melanoneura TaxID=428564 RepID=A0A8D8QNY1_9HEMI
MGQKSSTHSKWSYGYLVQKIPPHPSLCLSLIGLSFQGESIPHSFPNRYSLVNNGITAQRFTFRWKKKYSIKGEKAKWSERGSEYPLSLLKTLCLQPLFHFYPRILFFEDILFTILIFFLI